jgi:hypothetical protein
MPAMVHMLAAGFGMAIAPQSMKQIREALPT